MRIGIDARMLFATTPTAHAAIVRQLLLHNARAGLSHEFILYTDDPAHSLGDLWAPNVSLRLVPRHTCRSDVYWLNFKLPRCFRRDHLDVYFSCFYKIPLLTRVACVNMIHDTAFFNLPSSLLTGRQASLLYRLLLYMALRTHCRKAVQTITVSEFSKACLIRCLRLDERRLSVCYNPVDPLFFAAGCSTPLPLALGLPSEYCLFVGSAIPKKNIAGTLNAFAGLPECLRRRYPLVLRTKPEKADLQLAEQLKVSGYIQFLPATLSFQEIAALISHARLLVLLSYEEGFGLPVAEAMAARVPVLVSAGGSLNEITGGLGLELSNSTVADLSRAWARLLTDARERQRLIRAGAVRAEQFRSTAVSARIMNLIVSTVQKR